MSAILAYFRVLGIMTDEWLSALTGGAVNETISLRVARGAANGSRPACWVCWVLSKLIETDHCAKTLTGDSTTPDAALRAGLIVLVIWLIIVYGWMWLL